MRVRLRARGGEAKETEAELQALREAYELPRVVAVNKVDLPAAWQPREFEGLDGVVVVEM